MRRIGLGSREDRKSIAKLQRQRAKIDAEPKRRKPPGRQPRVGDGQSVGVSLDCGDLGIRYGREHTVADFFVAFDQAQPPTAARWAERASIS